MSGPKSSSYHVDNSAEIERRALAQATSRLERARAEGRAAQREADRVAAAYGGESTQLDLRAEVARHSSAVAAQAQGLEQATAALRSQTREARRAARSALVRAIVDTDSVGTHRAQTDAGVATEVAQMNEAAKREAAAVERTRRAAQVAELLGQLTSAAPVEALERVSALASAAVEAGTPTADGLVMELRAAVSQENGIAVARSAATAAAAPALAALDGVGSDAANALRAELEASITHLTPVRSDAFDEAQEIARSWASANDVAFATSIIADGLQDLGYFVEEGFETLVVGGDGALVRADGGGHGVRVFRGGNDRLVFSPVALSPDTTAAEQVAFEHAFCADYAVVAHGAAEHGVRLGLEVDRPAGEGVEGRLATSAAAKAPAVQRRRAVRERAQRL